MFKWFWTIFSMGAPGICHKLLKRSRTFLRLLLTVQRTRSRSTWSAFQSNYFFVLNSLLTRKTISMKFSLLASLRRKFWHFCTKTRVTRENSHSSAIPKRPHCLLKVLENEADGYQSPRVCASARKLRWEHFQHGNQVTLLSKLQFITIYEQNIDKKTILPKNWIIKDVNTSKKIFRQFLIKIAFFLYSITFLTFSTLRSSSLWRTFLKNKNFVFVTFRLPQVK